MAAARMARRYPGGLRGRGKDKAERGEKGAKGEKRETIIPPIERQRKTRSSLFESSVGSASRGKCKNGRENENENEDEAKARRGERERARKRAIAGKQSRGSRRH